MKNTLLGLALFVLGYSVSQASLPKETQGTLLVVSKAENSVAYVDIQSGEISHRLPTGQGPHELVVSPDGKWAVVSDFVGGNSLTIIDIANKKSPEPSI